MCGITGFLYLRSASGSAVPDLGQLNQMTDLLTHRGPDDRGTFYRRYNSCTVGLGHRRLSILDLSGGRQPWRVGSDSGVISDLNSGSISKSGSNSSDSSDSDVLLVFNGEIYNYPVLKPQLQERGYVFSSTCDTEAIPFLYREYGADFVAHLSGMFALALWDESKRQLILARDPIGKKPLYYAVNEKRILFASELKSVIACEPTLQRELDPVATDQYFTLQYIPAPKTIYKNIRKLAPGEVLILSVESDRLVWRLEQNRQSVKNWIDAGRRDFVLRHESYDETKRRLRTAVFRAVEDRMVSDVPLGAFLSGGIDSTIIVGAMQALSSRPVKTFSIGFDDPRFDETSYARLAADHLKTDHTEFRVTPDGISLLDGLLTHFDEPFADSSALPTWIVSQLARQEVTVALTGDGGDELFLGYDRYKAVQIGATADRFCPAFLRRFLSRLICGTLPPNLPQGTLLRKLRRFAECFAMSGLERYLDWVCYFNQSQRIQLFTEDFQRSIQTASDNPSLDYLASFYDTRLSSEPARQIAFIDLQSYLPEDLLVKVDRTSMANSLECRSPFLDQRVVELAAGIPQSWDLTSVFSPRCRTKKILVDAFSDFLPPDIQTRPKMGFGVPLVNWFKSGPLHDLAHDVFSSQTFTQSGVFQPESGKRLLEEHVGGSFDNSLRLWALLFYALFLKNGSSDRLT